MTDVCLSEKLSQNSHQGYSAKNGGSYLCLDGFSPEIALGLPEYEYDSAVDPVVARYYDATIGRFISADTIVPDWTNPQSLNRYSYCLNNPLKYIDPSGNDVVQAPDGSWWEVTTITVDGQEVTYSYSVTNPAPDQAGAVVVIGSTVITHSASGLLTDWWDLSGTVKADEIGIDPKHMTQIRNAYPDDYYNSDPFWEKIRTIQNYHIYGTTYPYPMQLWETQRRQEGLTRNLKALRETTIVDTIFDPGETVGKIYDVATEGQDINP